MTSISMRRRLAVGLAGAFAAASALVATTAGASHAVDCTTTVTLTAYKKTNVFKESNYLTASTTSSCGTPYVGETTILRRTSSGSWNEVATSSYASGAAVFSSDSTTFNSTGTYVAVYSGGTDGANTYPVAQSSLRTINVIRAVQVADRSTRRASVGVFTIRPAASISGRRAVFQVWRNGGWRAYKSVLVSSTGSIRVTFANSRKGIRYRMVLPTGGGFVTSVHGPIVARRY